MFGGACFRPHFHLPAKGCPAFQFLNPPCNRRSVLRKTRIHTKQNSCLYCAEDVLFEPCAVHISSSFRHLCSSGVLDFRGHFHPDVLPNSPNRQHSVYPELSCRVSHAHGKPSVRLCMSIRYHARPHVVPERIGNQWCV